MVLENASDPSTGDIVDASIPTSDRDPYSSSETSSGQPQGGLPAPMPIIGPLLGFKQSVLSKLTHHRFIASQNLLGRSLTTDEQQAMTYWAAKEFSIQSYGAAAGVGAGLWRTYKTVDTFQFPFYKPNLEKFPTDAFPSRQRPLLTDMKARFIWHAIRASAYTLNGWFVATVIAGSYATTVGIMGQLQDPRMKEIMSQMREKAQREKGRLPQPQGDAQTGNPPVWKGRPKAVDDASSTGGAFEETLSLGSDRMLTDEDMKAQEMRRVQATRQPSPQESTYEPRTPTYQSTPRVDRIPQQSEPSNEGTFFDDASPTGGRGLQYDTQTPAAPTGSAWDRIRQQAGSRSNTQSAGQSAWAKTRSVVSSDQPSSPSDSFAFSKTEEERQLAKDEAQKDFDARIEQERRGGDFSSSNQRRW
jgi:hypothetical protein